MKNLIDFPLTMSHMRLWMKNISFIIGQWIRNAGDDYAAINFINDFYKEVDIKPTISDAPHMFFYFFDEKGIFITIPVIITASGVEYSYLILPRDSEKAPSKWWTDRKEAEKEAVMDACALYEAIFKEREISL